MGASSVGAATSGPVAFAVDSGDGNASSHRIADATGLNLFDSGWRPPGSSFVADLFAAGTFAVADAATGAAALIGVPDRVVPAGTGLEVVFGERPAPAGYVYDVQVQRPGSPGFVDAWTGQTRRRRSFQPDAGPGAYRFRSRMRSIENGAASEYSPPVAIIAG